jgi:hypothetical protein
MVVSSQVLLTTPSVAQLIRDDIPMGWNEQARLFEIA